MWPLLVLVAAEDEDDDDEEGEECASCLSKWQRAAHIYICTVNNSMCSPETLAEEWSTVWLVLALRPHPRYCLVHSQYGGSSISMIDKLLCAGPNFPLEENAPHWFMPSGGAAHFPIILCFVSLFTARLHSPRPAAPDSFVVFCSVPSLNVLRVSSCRALGDWIKCWIHFFISFIYSFVQSVAHRARWGFVWSWADTHISLGRGPRGTPVSSCSWSGGFSRQGRRSYRCYCVCVCVWESNLTAKRPYGPSYIYLFLSQIDGLLLSIILQKNHRTTQCHNAMSILNYRSDVFMRIGIWNRFTSLQLS